MPNGEVRKVKNVEIYIGECLKVKYTDIIHLFEKVESKEHRDARWQNIKKAMNIEMSIGKIRMSGTEIPIVIIYIYLSSNELLRIKGVAGLWN